METGISIPELERLMEGGLDQCQGCHYPILWIRGKGAVEVEHLSAAARKAVSTAQIPGLLRCSCGAVLVKKPE